MGLQWSTPVVTPRSLPSGIERSYVQGPQGSLELLIANPSHLKSSSRKQPVFFVHGGFGSANVWIEWMNHLSRRHSIPCYAISMRGHGNSYYPSFWRMVFGTTMDDLSRDIISGIRAAQELEAEATGGAKKDMVLVGHSSGGGLSQHILSTGMGGLHANGLVLAGAIPNFGSIGVYRNWARTDPFFLVRQVFHLMHPRSPLSSTNLVKQVFFCKEKPYAEVQVFEEGMSPYESYPWPFGMMCRFCNVKSIIRRINGWDGEGAQRVLIMTGSSERLVTPDLANATAEEYKDAFRSLSRTRPGLDKSETRKYDETYAGNLSDKVGFYIVKGAGHHLQNDLQWEDGANRLAEFIEQL